MKKLTVILFAAFMVYFTSCGNNSNNTTNKDTKVSEPPTGPAPDNSDATNPSLGDTSYTDSVH